MSKEMQRHIWLSWKLIEWKLMYYYPDLIADKYHDILSMPDDEYDKYELEYLRLCRKLCLPNTVVHKDYGMRVAGEGMMEVDLDRPCVRLVLSKYGRK